MAIADTITVTNLLYSRFIVVEKSYPDSNETIKPMNQLWSSTTLISHNKSDFVKIEEEHPDDYFISSLMLLFFILTAIFSRELVITFPNIFKSLFSFKKQVKWESKLSESNQRNIAALLAAIYFPLFIAFSFGDYFDTQYGIERFFLLAASAIIILSYWIFKSIILRFLGWITKSKVTFILVGKIGYNHLILSVFMSFPFFLIPLFKTQADYDSLLKWLSICILSAYVLFLIKGYKAIISSHFSHFFYILYLCTVELLPIALMTHFLLSYQ